MRRFIAILTLATALCAMMKVQAQTENAKDVWEELAESSETMSSLSALGRELKLQLLDQMPNLADTTLNEVMDSVQVMAKNYMYEKTIPVLKKHFTEDDARQIVAFYQTPVGQKVREERPLVMLEMSKEMADFSKALNDKVMAVLEKNKK